MLSVAVVFVLALLLGFVFSGWLTLKLLELGTTPLQWNTYYTYLAAMDLLLGELALDHHLRGDAGVIETGLPEHVAAAHAHLTDEDVLKRVVEGVAHVERAGYVRRRDHDGKSCRALLAASAGGERLGVFPGLGDPRFNVRGFEGLVQHDAVFSSQSSLVLGDGYPDRPRKSTRSARGRANPPVVRHAGRVRYGANRREHP